MNSRINWIDYSKGIGIILVVLGHVLDGLYKSNLKVIGFDYIFKLIYSFHMPLFFLISGLFAEKWLSKENKIIVKVKALLIPYFIWSLIQGSTTVILSRFTNSTNSWGILLKITYEPIMQFWFLYVLFIFFILYALLRSKLSLNVVFIGSIVFFFMSPLIHIWLFGKIAFNFVFFVLGAMINKDLDLYNQFLNYKCIPLLSATLLLGLSLPSNNIVFKLIAALSGIVLVNSLSIILDKVKNLRLVNYFGQYSMEIYLLHILAGSGIRIILSKILHINNIYIHITLGVIGGIFLPLLVVKTMKNLKLVSVMLGRKHQVKNSVA